MSVNYPTAWDQQEGETDKAYNGFRTYLMMPQPRSYKRVAEKLGVTIDHIKAWGARYNWRMRARQYDAFMVGQLDQQYLDDLKAFQAQVVSEEIKDYQRMRAVWEAYLENMVENVEEIKPDEFLDRMKKLTQVRTMIDQMARKSASLPNTYRAAELPSTPTKQDDTPILLTLDGPKKQLPEGSKVEDDGDE